MKLLSFATFVAVAGIAQVLAIPLLVVSSGTSVIPHHNNDPAVVGKPEFVAKMKKGPCRAHRISQKAVEISNLFREALGLPLIKSDGQHPSLGDGKVKILPFIGTPNAFITVDGKNTEGGIKFVSLDGPHDRHPPHHGQHGHGRHHHHHKGHHRFGKGSFINRIHYSIMNLGRWEGRAVAFVLGCGIGVLLRMLFVFAVVILRAVKGQHSEEHHEYSQITIIEEIIESPKSSPPAYVDEKVPVVVETVKAPSSAEESK